MDRDSCLLAPLEWGRCVLTDIFFYFVYFVTFYGINFLPSDFKLVEYLCKV